MKNKEHISIANIGFQRFLFFIHLPPILYNQIAGAQQSSEICNITWLMLNYSLYLRLFVINTLS